MVSLEELSALDLQIWLRNGQHAAGAARCNQSTICRRVERTLKGFGLSLARRDGEWTLYGNPLLLTMEREIHQLARFQGLEPLRLEVSPLMAPLVAEPAPRGWLLGRNDAIGMVCPLRLLRQRVIDAWLIDNTMDLPPREDAEIARFDLGRYPLGLAASPDHPLARERGVSFDDLRRFPVPQLPSELFPNTSGHLADLAFGGPLQLLRRYDPADWEGRTADGASLTYATPFNLAQHPDLRRIDSVPLLINGVSLVVRRDRIEMAPILALKQLLEARLRQLAPKLQDLEPQP
jgi:hypothetical protein